MNKRAARILILFLVFAASVGVFTHLMSHETTENATDLDAASLPVLYMKTADTTVNRMYGYCQEMNGVTTRENLTPLPMDRSLTLEIDDERNKKIKNVTYTVESTDGGALIEKLGAEIVDISLPHTDYAISTYYLIAPAEASTNLSRYDGVSYGSRVDGEDIVSMMTNTRTAKFGPEVKRRIMIGNYALSAGYYDAYYLKALKVRTLVKQDFDNAFKDVDVILAPVAPTPAYKLGSMANDPLKMYLMDIFTVPLNLAGLPGISIPCGRSKDNMPIGMQFIGRPLDEETIIRAAYTYEVNHDYANKIGQGVE